MGFLEVEVAEELMGPPQSTQTWHPDRYARNARFVSDLGAAVLDVLSARSGERILDLGCGDGALTEKLMSVGCDVVGVDASDAMVAAARARGVDAHVADAHALGFVGEFDAVFSNAALHWMTSPERVAAGVFRALKPGGRFCGEFGGRGNVAAIAAALEAALLARRVAVPSPWFFPDEDEYSRILEGAGFEVDWIRLFPRPTPVPGDMRAWLEMFGHAFLGAVSPTEKEKVIADVTDALRPVLCDADGRWTIDYVRLRFLAHRPR